MGRIVLENVTKSFGDTEVIPPLNLTIEDGEFAVFVGPSGCGKSTLLRLIAGLEDCTSGKVIIDDQDVTEVSPSKRGLAMVFQTRMSLSIGGTELSFFSSKSISFNSSLLPSFAGSGSLFSPRSSSISISSSSSSFAFGSLVNNYASISCFLFSLSSLSLFFSNKRAFKFLVSGTGSAC